MTPALQGERLRLLPYRAGMVTERHIAWLNDPEIVRYSEQRHRTHTLESQHEYLNSFPRGSHIWLIVLTSDEVRPWEIGTITAYVDQPNEVANMGIMIGERSVWGKGYGLEAWNLVTDYLFDNGMRKIEAGCMDLNVPMRRLAAKARMECEAIIYNHFLFEGRGSHLWYYGRMWP